jgi:hypothetical protein
MKRYIGLYLGSCFLLSCLQQDPINIDQDQLWTDFTLIYDAHQDKTLICAQFRYDQASGSILRISEPAAVSFNDLRLTYAEHLSAYTLSIDGKVSQGTLIFTDSDQKEYINEINLSAPIELPAINEINRSEDLSINWLGNPVGANEEVRLIQVGNNNTYVDLSVQSAANSLLLTVPQIILSGISDAQMDLMIHRIYHSPIINSTAAGGKLTSIYRDCKFNIPLK